MVVLAWYVTKAIVGHLTARKISEMSLMMSVLFRSSIVTPIEIMLMTINRTTNPADRRVPLTGMVSLLASVWWLGSTILAGETWFSKTGPCLIPEVTFASSVS